jgi:branched-chain amino acid transport system permease protein
MDQLINAIVLGSIYCLFALGLSLTWGTLNVLNLAHGAVFMFAGFTCYLVTQHLGWNLPIPLLVLIAMAVGAIVELALDLLVFRPVQKRSADAGQAELSMLIASIGAASIPVVIAQKVTTDSQFTITKHASLSSTHHLFGAVITNIEIAIVVVTLTLTVALGIWVSRTRSGRALRALAIDSETSGLMGISKTRLSALALSLSGASAGMAGVFLGVFLSNLSPESGQDLLLKAFAAVVLGGVGSVWGTLVGAFVLAGGETFVTATTSGTWTDAVSFGIIIVVLLFMPNGLFGQVKVDRA